MVSVTDFLSKIKNGQISAGSKRDDHWISDQKTAFPSIFMAAARWFWAVFHHEYYLRRSLAPAYCNTFLNVSPFMASPTCPVACGLRRGLRYASTTVTERLCIRLDPSGKTLSSTPKVPLDTWTVPFPSVARATTT